MARVLLSRRTSAAALPEGRPARAGIDPYNKLIDREPGDNVRAVVQR